MWQWPQANRINLVILKDLYSTESNLEMNVIDKFESIAHAAMSDAAKIKCSLTEYVEGLHAMQEVIEGYISAGETDLDREMMDE